MCSCSWIEEARRRLSVRAIMAVSISSPRTIETGVYTVVVVFAGKKLVQTSRTTPPPRSRRACTLGRDSPAPIGARVEARSGRTHPCAAIVVNRCGHTRAGGDGSGIARRPWDVTKCQMCLQVSSRRRTRDALRRCPNAAPHGQVCTLGCVSLHSSGPWRLPNCGST